MRVIAALPSAKARRYQNTILGTSGYQSSMPMVPIDSQGMTFCWCSIVTSCLGGTVVELKAVEVSNRNPQEKIHRASKEPV